MLESVAVSVKCACEKEEKCVYVREIGRVHGVREYVRACVCLCVCVSD